MNRKYWYGLMVLALIAGFCGGLFFKDISASTPAYAQSGASTVELKWEPIEQESGSRMERAMIQVGWLVRAGGGDSITFVPDPKHEWK
ncbi:MAG: hypothetical protein V2I97_13230 [Desulfococcaceae bacterium]|jgi:hypothetical protein|nr:hypothetical protein [Desulfococcaceae bacterium]